MMRGVGALGLFLLVATVARGARTAQKGNPVQKVIDLLERMESQIQTEGKTEAAAYDKFACFCKEQADEKMYRITKGKEKMEMLTSSIELLEAEIAQLDKETEETKQSIDDLTKEMEDNDSKREEDFAAFASDRSDLQDAIERLEQGIEDMSGSKDKMSGAGVKKSLLGQGAEVSPADAEVIAEVDQALKVQNQTEAKKAAMLAQGSTVSVAAAEHDGLTTAKDLTKSWQKDKDWRRRSLQLIATGPVKPTKEQAEVLLLWSSSRQPSFEFSSNKHIDILKDLLKAYKQQLYERETEEAGDKHKYTMAKNANQHNHDSLTSLKNKLEATSAAKSEEKGNQEKDLEQTTQDTDADQSFLDELTDDCEKKAEAWDARSHVRSNELTALAECLGIMKKGVVGAYGANRKLVGLVAEHTERSEVVTKEDGADEDDEEDDEDKATFFLQRRKKNTRRLSGKEKTARKQRIMDLLAKKGQSMKDAILSSTAMKVRENNFGEVKKLIGDLIKKLEDEAKAAEEESAWCKDELEAATTKRDENTANIDKETSAITLGKAKIETLKIEVKGLTDDISELYKALNEQTKLREEDHVDNDKTLADTRAGLAALTAAREVLENFYNDPTALLQRQQQTRSFSGKGPDADGNSLEDLAPESDSFTGDNQGKQDEGKGIIDLLTTIGGDFERTIKSTEQAEADNEADFQEFKSSTEGDIDEKKGAVDTKEGEIKTTGAEVEQDTEDFADAKEMKANAITELEKLEPVCLDSGASFQERKKRREQEIAALEEAMKIIDEL